MKQTMAQLKTFNTKQLLHLLQNCANDKRACEFLSYALHKQSITQSIH